MSGQFSHVLPGEHIYEGVLFFGWTPADTLNAVKDFQIFADDAMLITYPKAGTTWLQEVVWLIMNDGDIAGAKQKQVYFRSPFIEFKDEILNEIGLDLAAQTPRPRVMKTHLPVRLAPTQLWTEKAKMLVLFRNPKDVCVSYYHFYKSSSSFGNYKGSWEEFLEMFKSGHVDHGSWFDFTKSWWDKSDNPNLKIIFYEDMKRDLEESVRDISKFLNKSLAPETIKQIAEHCSFDSMKTNPMTNHLDVYSINAKVSPLLRKGTVGDWKTHFTVMQNDAFDEFYKEAMKAYDIPFQYELDF
ncbi:sulfotransferase 1C2-like [Tubulanus polymorphus]|uniref:sulfotransferase 1C2-like n=1 Tax=Tubulanus polymorphus TaxID=672921 RepID=UPI003DA3CB65